MWIKLPTCCLPQDVLADFRDTCLDLPFHLVRRGDAKGWGWPVFFKLCKFGRGILWTFVRNDYIRNCMAAAKLHFHLINNSSSI